MGGACRLPSSMPLLVATVAFACGPMSGERDAGSSDGDAGHVVHDAGHFDDADAGHVSRSDATVDADRADAGHGASGLPHNLTVGMFTEDDRAAYCDWWVDILGGEGQLDCMVSPDYTLTLIVSHSGCIQGFANLSEVCSWRVAELEACGLATMRDPCAPVMAPECRRPADCVP